MTATVRNVVVLVLALLLIWLVIGIVFGCGVTGGESAPPVTEMPHG